MSETATEPKPKLHCRAASLCHGYIKTLAIATLILTPLAAQGTDIEPGDTVVVSSDGTKLMLGTEVRAELTKGTEIKVSSIRDDWLGGYVTADGKKKPGWVERGEVWPKIEVTIPSTTTFTLKTIEPILRRAESVYSLPRLSVGESGGWISSLSKSEADPSKIVDVFDSLRLKRGFVLRAYQFVDELGSSGYVWAMPAEADFPEPIGCRMVECQSLWSKLPGPKPPDALDDPMQAIIGDGSARSYLSASLLKRELEEFLAQWHGTNWHAHVLLDESPWEADGTGRPSDLKMGQRPPEGKHWKVLQPLPKEWRPHVQMEKDRVTVTFYTWTALYEEAVYRHIDTYEPGSYCSKTEYTKIAAGPWGIVW